MNNPLTATADVVINGVTYTLRIDFAAIAYLQNTLGVETIPDVFQAKLTSAENLPIVLAALLQNHWKGVTPQELEHADIALFPTIKAVNKIIMYALYGAEGKPESPLPEALPLQQDGVGGNV
jgi:hypothetical protein